MLGPGFEYTYTISTDFPLGKVNITVLEQTINASAIATPLLGVSTQADICNVVFESQLSSPDKVLLDGNTSPPSGSSIIGSHDGDPVPSESLWFAELPRPVKTNSTRYIKVLTLTANNLGEGSYLIRWLLSLGSTLYTLPIAFRVLLDDTTILLEKRFTPPLARNAWTWVGAVLDYSYFIKRDLTEGTHTITLQILSTDISQTAVLENALISIAQV